ncbi:hypothetical protein PAXRUDRAFT_834455 [Paxillus rubicundulus Ve08.2h10]|uniref:Uncharacterized protein n=1 Tax=Paxillus rubicundulus Ve08.2h10 TaxID=930991 RepID=A0A0D0DKL4_9AGAM|nr:hypothetical protein PAXRUDRAFT_834455 [Paxillus rubicundulus Ve08.2h10]
MYASNNKRRRKTPPKYVVLWKASHWLRLLSIAWTVQTQRYRYDVQSTSKTKQES